MSSHAGAAGPQEPTAGLPTIGAVVLNWHDPVNTAGCVASLADDPLIALITVVDNESDGTLRAALDAAGDGRIQLIEVPENRGFSGGVNLGLEALELAGVEAILVINNDAVAHQGSIELLARRLLTDPGAGIVAPLILNPDGTVQTAGSRISRLTGMARNNLRPRRTDYLTWACVLLRTAMVREIGPLDERFFMYWEDADFSRRARAAGYTLAVEPAAVVTHALSASGARAGSRLREYSVWSLLQYGDKHAGTARLMSRIALAGTLAARVLRSDADGLKAVLRGARRPRSSAPAWRELWSR